MATRIRLRRVGRKKQPEFRIVVAEHTAARDGRFIETLGHYRPREKPAVVQVNADRARTWLAQGARPTETVRSLLKKAGVFAAAASTAQPPSPPTAG
jgi:small subunit ribosomal protein S16